MTATNIHAHAHTQAHASRAILDDGRCRRLRGRRRKVSDDSTWALKCRYILRLEAGSSHGSGCTTWDRLVLAFGTARRGRGRTKARGFVVTDLRMAGSTWYDDAGVGNSPRGNIFPSALQAPRGRSRSKRWENCCVEKLLAWLDATTTAGV